MSLFFLRFIIELSLKSQNFVFREGGHGDGGLVGHGGGANVNPGRGHVVYTTAKAKAAAAKFYRNNNDREERGR